MNIFCNSSTRDQVDISRFKMGEMPPPRKETTNPFPADCQVSLPRRGDKVSRRNVDAGHHLMGKPELRFGYIREHAYEVIKELDV